MALVELNVFSGRANPRWGLDEGDSGVLARLPDGLPSADRARPVPPDLGHRGFLVEVGGRSWRVRGAYVVGGDGDARADVGRTVEMYLLDRLPAEHAELRQVVEARHD